MNQRALASAITDAVIPLVADALAAAIEPLVKRIKALEERAPVSGEPGKDGRDGVDGKDAEPVDMGVIKELLVEEVAKSFATVEKPKDGTSVTLEDVIPEIRKAVAEEYAANPPAAGKDGSDGKDVDVEEVVQKAVALLPVPKDGRDGVDGKDGKDGLDGKAGRDGEGIKELLTDADGVLVVTMTNGEIKRVGRVIGRDGKDGAPGMDGRDGADGLGFDDMTADLAEDGRTVEIRMVKGENVKVIPIKFDVPLEAGIWKDGHRYSKGDGVTFGGSFWFAQKNDPQGRPGDNGNTDWRLGVKKGRDGKDGKMPPGPIGPVSVPAAKS
jgi:hypothetical protein